MRFSKYFDAWLNEGYYKEAVNIGKSGDFYTAVSVGELFGALIAKHIKELFDKGLLSLPANIVEFGANEGFLLKDIIKYLDKELLKELSFYIVEPHEKLRKRQEKELFAYFKPLNIKHIKDISQIEAKNSFFYANELFDCFAPELIAGDKMLFIREHKFIFKKAPKPVIELARALAIEKGELCFGLEPFLNSLKKLPFSFIFACFDYFKKGPCYDFTLRIYKNHQYIDPFKSNLKELYQKSDLTYSVNEAHFKLLLKKLDFKLLAFKKQSLALIDFGLHELIDELEDKNKFLLQAKNLIFGFDDSFCFLEFKKNSF